MSEILNNRGYFLKETLGIFRLNLISNIFSLLSTALIFSMLSLVIASWWINNDIIESLKDQAEISIFLENQEIEASNKELQSIMDKLQDIDGILEVQYINKESAYIMMEEVLGDEAEVLSVFSDNPFQAYLEVTVDLGQLDNILSNIETLDGIDTIRDNKEVLEHLEEISVVLNIISSIVLVAVALSTIVITSHIIRQGIYHYREQINTLDLLGASKVFIAMPFYLEGLFMTLVSGGLAILGTYGLLSVIFTLVAGPLPFIPLPDLNAFIIKLSIIMLGVTIILGIAGSVFGMKSLKS